MVTIILPVSRDYYLKRIFAQLEFLTCDRAKTNILVYVDGPAHLFQLARNLTIKSKFNERLCIYRHKGQPNVGSVKRRRRRIADIHNEAKELLNQTSSTDYIFLIEDDTLLPVNALEKLLKIYSVKPHAGLLSGVQIGRWGFDHIGAWTADDVYEPKHLISVPGMDTAKTKDTISEVDATGLYCCLTRFENYMNFKFEPFEDALGPDVAFGLHLRRQGLQNYIDYSIKCDHLTKRETITFNRPIIQVQLKKLETNDWSQGQL